MIAHLVEVWVSFVVVFAAGCGLGGLAFARIARGRFAAAQWAATDAVATLVERVRGRLGTAPVWYGGRMRQPVVATPDPPKVAEAAEAAETSELPAAEETLEVEEPDAVWAIIEQAITAQEAEPEVAMPIPPPPAASVEPDAVAYGAELVVEGAADKALPPPFDMDALQAALEAAARATDEELAEVEPPPPRPVVLPPPALRPPQPPRPVLLARPESRPNPGPADLPVPLLTARNDGEPAVGPFESRRPPSLIEPRGGGPDNLQRIRGIGERNEVRLNKLGIFHFSQIAAWTPAEVRWIGEQLAFPERIEHDDWVGQAIVLASGGQTGFVKSAARRRARRRGSDDSDAVDES